jgi:hypothetical protein
VFVLLLTASVARARPVGERVAVVVPEAGAPSALAEVEQRTRAELEAAGFEVVVVVAPENADLNRISTEARALGALQIRRGGGGGRVTVHVVDRVTGKSSSRDLEESHTREPHRVALRAVELLYASLLELEARSQPRGEVTATPLVAGVARYQARAPVAVPDWSLRAGAVGLTSAGGVGSLVGIELGAVRYVTTWLGVSAVLGATAPTLVREGNASASFGLGLARLAALLEPWPLARFSPALELRGGILGALADGDSEARAPTRLEAGSTPFLGGALSSGIYLHREFRLRAGIDVSVALQPLELRFAGERVAAFGQPWFGASLGAEWLYSGGTSGR